MLGIEVYDLLLEGKDFLPLDELFSFKVRKQLVRDYVILKQEEVLRKLSNDLLGGDVVNLGESIKPPNLNENSLEHTRKVCCELQLVLSLIL